MNDNIMNDDETEKLTLVDDDKPCLPVHVSKKDNNEIKSAESICNPCSLIVVSAPLLFISCLFIIRSVTTYFHENKHLLGDANHDYSNYYSLSLPTELFGDEGVYKTSDFTNHNGHTVPYWGDFNIIQADNLDNIYPHWGPCYVPKQSDLDKIDWQELIDKSKENNGKNIQYKAPHHYSQSYAVQNLPGFCRPGFLIIGAGKCGTSSLYHYLIEHPKVLPAIQKQIHYFRYFTDRSMEWYLSNFPSTDSFLSSGALITGEAAPGYLPYPEVAHKIKSWMTTYAGNGGNETYKQPVSLPKIITLVRNPLERSYSSYKYNYVTPALEKLRTSYHGNIPSNQSDEFYINNYLFTFEEMIEAELNVLTECLKPNGSGETDARKKYGGKTWIHDEFERRREKNLPGMVSLDDSCYGGIVSKSVPRKQWAPLVEKYPDKIINIPNLHLVQSFIGRSLYTLPLEWWYAMYDRQDLHVVCSEDLKNEPAKAMGDVANFLGLPEFDFTNVVSSGMYNVGTSQGYDTLTEWTDTSELGVVTDIPLSDEMKKRYLTFVQPFNERLFGLIGKECQWID